MLILMVYNFLKTKKCVYQYNQIVLCVTKKKRQIVTNSYIEYCVE